MRGKSRKLTQIVIRLGEREGDWMDAFDVGLARLHGEDRDQEVKTHRLVGGEN